MATDYQFRIIQVVPQQKVGSYVSFMKTNIGADSVPAGLGPDLSATGSVPHTHNWFGACYKDSEMKLIADHDAQLAGLAVADWANLDFAGKIAWINTTLQAPLWSVAGIWITAGDNTGAWPDPEAVLTATGLKRVITGAPSTLEAEERDEKKGKKK